MKYIHQPTGKSYGIWPDANLQGVDLTGAKLDMVELQGADLTGANLTGVDLTGAGVEGANLRGARLRRARLSNAHLAMVDLEGADLEGANLTGTDLGSADLTGANLQGVNLTGAYLGRTNLEGANLEGANLENAHTPHANFDGANLTGTCLDPNAPLPEVPVENLREAGFGFRGGWVYGWRTRLSTHIGSAEYVPKETYIAPVFSVAKAECHPGIYVMPTRERAREWSERYRGGGVVRVRFRRRDLCRAFNKWRVRRLAVLRESDEP